MASCATLDIGVRSFNAEGICRDGRRLRRVAESLAMSHRLWFLQRGAQAGRREGRRSPRPHGGHGVISLALTSERDTIDCNNDVFTD